MLLKQRIYGYRGRVLLLWGVGPIFPLNHRARVAKLADALP